MNESLSAEQGRLRLGRRQLLAGTGAASAAFALRGLLQSAPAYAAGASGNLPSHPRWRFVFVNHVTTNPFFVPTQYGIQDACGVLGCTYQWAGSETSQVGQMVNAMNEAISAKADGIAVSIIDPTAFNDPVQRALAAGIPVVSYNADAPASSHNERLAYLGQDLYVSGVMMGQRIVQLVKSGHVVLFIATPGSLNIQPRIDGAADAIKKSGASITYEEIATGPTVNEELSRIDAYYQGHKTVKGMFAVDAGSTQGVGQVMQKYGLAAQGVHAGGYDLLPTTLQLIKGGHLDFTIDQQPYLQGFYPVVELFTYKLSGGLTGPADCDTGLKFITKASVDPYLRTQTRFEGSSSTEKLVQIPK